MSRLPVEIKWIDIFRSEPDLRHLIKPGFDLTLEFRFFASWARLIKRPCGCYVLSNTESICFFVLMREKKVI